MSRDLAERLRVVVDAPEVVAAGHRRERAVERQNLEAVLRQLQLADDLGPEQRHDVRTDGKLEPGDDLFGDGRAADDVTPLDDEHLATRARQIRRRRQAVVPGADDDGVVLTRHAGTII